MEIIGASGAELAWLAGALLAAGLLMGFLAGLFGIGGGGILVPILYELFRVMGIDDDIRMHLAVGTALLVIIPTSLRSVFSHRSRGAVDGEILRTIGPGVFLGVIAGVLIARKAEAELLQLVFIGFYSTMAVKVLAGGDRFRLGTKLPGLVVRTLYGFVTGVISTLIGIGGGALITSFMLFYGRPIHQAVGTASGFGPIIAIPAALGFVWAGWNAMGLPPGSLGYVSVLGALLIVPTSVLAAPLGVRVAHAMSRRHLELAFAAFLIIVALRFVVALLIGD